MVNRREYGSQDEVKCPNDVDSYNTLFKKKKKTYAISICTSPRKMPSSEYVSNWIKDDGNCWNTTPLMWLNKSNYKYQNTVFESDVKTARNFDLTQFIIM